MAGEGKHQDYKLSFDVSSPKAKVDLVKNIVAIANCGGGRIIFGCDETQRLGIDKDTVRELDSARISDILARYVSPAVVEVSHETIKLQEDKYIHTLEIIASKYPVVMSRQGMWKGADTKTDKPLFLEGDIWTRHSSKTERITYQDLHAWIDDAKRRERESLLEKITLMANLPEGSTVEVISSSGEVIDNASRLIRNACYRREHDPNHLLNGQDLLWAYLQRHQLTLDEVELGIVIGSALRRPATLFWWLLLAEASPNIIVNELKNILSATDRDKSDAAKSVVELACIYASDEDLQMIIEALGKSRYAHFRSAAQTWKNREDTLFLIRQRVENAKIDGNNLSDIPTGELEQMGTQLAQEYTASSTPALSQKLANVNRTIWLRKSRFSPH